MKWSICILTVPAREKELAHIKWVLEYQRAAAGLAEDVEILIDGENGTLGQKRQRCVEKAAGEYINFVDDDLVAHDYIATIYPLLDGVDYIGFQLQLYEDGTKRLPTYHSLQYSGWSEDELGFYRNVSHLNPIKRELAMRASFDGGSGEDFRWAQQMQPESEHYIDRPMYFYFHSRKYSLTMGNM